MAIVIVELGTEWIGTTETTDVFWVGILDSVYSPRLKYLVEHLNVTWREVWSGDVAHGGVQSARLFDGM